MSAAVIPFVRQPPKLIVPHLEAKRQDVRTRKVGIQLTDAVVAGMINLLRDGLAGGFGKPQRGEQRPRRLEDAAGRHLSIRARKVDSRSIANAPS